MTRFDYLEVKRSSMELAEPTLEQLVRDRKLRTSEIHRSNDFYGHAFQLKRILGIDPGHSLKVVLEHGPDLNEYIWEVDAKSKLPMFLCAAPFYAKAFKRETGKTSIPIGPYIHYLPETAAAIKRKPERETLLVFPKHSTHHFSISYDFDALLRVVEPWASRFDRVLFCLYWQDILRGHHLEFEKRGLECVTAGHIYDPNFLPRLVNLIGDASATASMWPGTSIIYSVLMNRPAWFFNLESSFESSSESAARQRRQIDEKMNASDQTYNNQMCIRFGKPVEEITPEQLNFIHEVAGYNQVKSSEELLVLLQQAEDLYNASRGGQARPISVATSGSQVSSNDAKAEISGSIEKDTVEMGKTGLLRQAMKHVGSNGNDSALRLVKQALQGGEPIKGTELLHAIILNNLGRTGDAREVVERELRLFPGNEDADLLRQSLAAQSEASVDHDSGQQSQNRERTTSLDMQGQVQEKMQTALKQLESGDAAAALATLSNAKAMKLPTEGLDYCRGLCFARMSRDFEALESMREELRNFPQNEQARRLHDELITASPKLTAGTIDEEEFRTLYQTVRPYTMLSEKRLYSLYSLARRVCEENLPGNFVECGVAGGGATALLAAVIRKYSNQARWIYAFDSFEGMPAPGEHDRHQGLLASETGWGEGTCAAPVESVREICEKLGVEDILKPVKGYFEETLPRNQDRVGMIALLHADADWYESTRIIFETLYDRLSNGACIQVDDYGHWEGAKKAVDEFMEKRSLSFSPEKIDYTGVWFSKPDRFLVNPEIPPDIVRMFNEDDPASKGIVSQMSPNERFQLYYAANEITSKESDAVQYVEIGSWEGASLRLIHSALSRNAEQVRGYAVEPNMKPQLQQALTELGGAVAHLRMFSQEAAPRIAAMFERHGGLADLIFIDGDHRYESVYSDITNYYPLLTPGGIMVFHDYLPPLDDRNREAIYTHHAGSCPGIRQAVEELMENQYKAEPLELPLLYPTDPTQTQVHLPIIPGVYSTIRAYRKPRRDGDAVGIRKLRIRPEKEGNEDTCVRHLNPGRTDETITSPKTTSCKGKTILKPDDLNWKGVRFLDPTGKVFEYEGEYYRAIYPEMAEYVRSLFDSGIIDHLVSNGFLIESSLSNLEVNGYAMVIKHRRIAYQTLALSWNRKFIRDAALCGINLNLELLKYGLGTRDFHPSNIQQTGICSPVWIDLGSIRPLSNENDMSGLGEFKKYFMNPLHLISDKVHLSNLVRHAIRYTGGISDEELSDLSVGTVPIGGKNRQEFLEAARDWLANLKFHEQDTNWKNYQKDARVLNYQQLGDERSRLVYRIIKHMKPSSVIDLSSSAGFFTFMAASLGADTYAIDYDEGAIERLYEFAKKIDEPLSITVAVGDVGTEWNVQADLVLALALSHHISISQRFPFSETAKMFSRYSTESLLVEFMPNGLGGIAPKPKPLPAWYNLSTFVEALRPYFRSIDIIYYPAPENYSHRIPLLCRERKDEGEKSETLVRSWISPLDNTDHSLVYRIICPVCGRISTRKIGENKPCAHCGYELELAEFTI